ncbi:HisA/HisF-related TIM barrel protein [Streptomyces sp. NPDC052101]|uniref:HisA/HisF-related TIM barrel protein n=1 Tax=Streptomyces sp. NPDC052101 TaxID=3155763 RepID=UPI003426C06A
MLMEGAGRIIAALDIDVQLMCRAGVDDGASLERALGTGCARLNLGRGDLADLAWCAQAIARHGGRVGVSDVSREGSLTGPNLPLLQEVCARTPAAVLAAGGITTLADLKAVAALRPQGTEGPDRVRSTPGPSPFPRRSPVCARRRERPAAVG